MKPVIQEFINGLREAVRRDKADFVHEDKGCHIGNLDYYTLTFQGHKVLCTDLDGSLEIEIDGIKIPRSWASLEDLFKAFEKNGLR